MCIRDRTLTLNDFTYINNRTVTTEMDTTTEPLENFGKEIFVELKSISYAKQYALNVFDNTNTSTITTATRIKVTLVNSSNNYCSSTGYMRNHVDRGNSNNGRCSENAEDGRDSFAPNVGTNIFSISTGTTLVDEGAAGGTLETNPASQSNTNYSYTVNIFNAANQGSQTGRNNLYFRIATTGQSVPFGSGSSVTYQARYTTTFDLLHGGEGWQTGDYFYVFMRDAYYKVTVEATSESIVQANLGLVRPSPTPFDTETTITAESILGDIRTQLIAEGNFTNSDITTIGVGLHIKRASAFNASTPVGELLNVVAGKIQDVGDLPKQCKNGYVVKVKNSAAEEDDYYLKFFANNGLSGDGVWEECAQPGRRIEFDKATMPIQLVRTSLTEFTVSQIDYDTCPVGDSITAPKPSFMSTVNGVDDDLVTVNKTINNMVFFRNRLVFVSDENVIMSRPGDFFYFWPKSAIASGTEDLFDLFMCFIIVFLIGFRRIQ